MPQRSHFVDQRFDLDDRGRVKIMATGDWHLGAKTCDEKKINDDIRRALDNGWYVLCMGDQLETATKVSPGSGVFEQDEPDEQVGKVIDILKPVQEAGRLIGMHHGN